jgi:predicted site-specific integrase-resolvase
VKRTYSTLEAAKQADIGRATLMRWLRDGKIRPSVNVPLAGGLELHRWTEADVNRLIKFKEKNYWRKER